MATKLHKKGASHPSFYAPHMDSGTMYAKQGLKSYM
jgi:hypothetical protein